MNAIEMLKEDHKKVKDLFRQYEQAGDNSSKKQQIARDVISELRIHSELEEQIFYPRVKQKTQEEDAKELIDEGIEEHHVVDQLMQELDELTPDDDQFDAKFKVLTENVEHHIEEEEGELMPKAQDALGDDKERVANEMQQLKQKLQRRAA